MPSAPSRLNCYSASPSECFDVSTELLLTIATARLKLLHALTASADPFSNLSSSNAESMEHDRIGHFFLRIVLAHDDSSRDWVVKAETKLFELRLKAEDPKVRNEFLNVISTSTTKQPNRSANNLPATPSTQSRLSILRVPFERVPELVANRKVLVSGGDALIPAELSWYVVVSCFRDRLAAAMDACAVDHPRLMRLEGDRLEPLINSLLSLHNRLIMGSWRGFSAARTFWRGGHIAASDVDSLAKANRFPPCMTMLHIGLRKDGHLRHQARLQYGLFLKDAGMPVDEAILFWRKAFERVHDDKSFEKKRYTYNIRHQYGLEGHRKSMQSYSCSKIVSECAPSASNHGGCPFVHADRSQLRTLLMTRMGMSNSQKGILAMQEIEDLVGRRKFESACGCAFAALHQSTELGDDNGVAVHTRKRRKRLDSDNATIRHPNGWFQMSREDINETQEITPTPAVDDGNMSDELL
ncbi:eukaryotic and archaeal DNA primase, large subunit-domain-containing protein [Cladochytrium replicatum]|nr:eukaryotic and archaeal DNA primase, large subunit-domain-containing protein [Cladochytrium replicatum]